MGSQANGVKWSFNKVSTSCACKSCKDGLVTTIPDVNAELGIDSGVLLEKVDKICYVGDVLNAAGRCDSAVMARVTHAWKVSRVLTYSNWEGILAEIER